MGGIELLAISKSKTAGADQITKLVENMQKKVAGIMTDIENSTTLKDITWPKEIAGKTVLKSIRFWLSLGFIAGLTLLTNYLVRDFRKLDVSTITYLTQVMFFVVIAIALYLVLGGLGSAKHKRKIAESILAKQTLALNNARSDLVNKASDTLDADVAKLQSLTSKLPTKTEALQPLKEGSERLRSMIDSFQLLNAAETNQLSKLPSGARVTELDSSLKQILDSEKSTIESKHIKIDAPEQTKLLLHGSPRLVQQVIGTVLSNAIEFSPNKGEVSIDLVSLPGKQGIVVSDEGPGVSKEQLKHMFQPFTKADGDDALRMNHEGLGIDLYVDKLIMEHLGGKISAESTLGKGTKVQLLWPTTS